jgi:hypothetical protein
MRLPFPGEPPDASPGEIARKDKLLSRSTDSLSDAETPQRCTPMSTNRSKH